MSVEALSISSYLLQYIKGHMWREPFSWMNSTVYPDLSTRVTTRADLKTKVINTREGTEQTFAT